MLRQASTALLPLSVLLLAGCASFPAVKFTWQEEGQRRTLANFLQDFITDDVYSGEADKVVFLKFRDRKVEEVLATKSEFPDPFGVQPLYRLIYEPGNPNRLYDKETEAPAVLIDMHLYDETLQTMDIGLNVYADGFVKPNVYYFSVVYRMDGHYEVTERVEINLDKDSSIVMTRGSDAPSAAGGLLPPGS